MSMVAGTKGRIRRRGGGGMVLFMGGMQAVGTDGAQSSAAFGFRATPSLSSLRTSPSSVLSRESGFRRAGPASSISLGVIRKDGDNNDGGLTNRRRPLQQRLRRRPPFSVRSTTTDEDEHSDPLDSPATTNFGERLVDGTAAANNSAASVDVFSILEAIDPSDPAAILDATIGIPIVIIDSEGGTVLADVAVSAPTWNDTDAESVANARSDASGGLVDDIVTVDIDDVVEIVTAEMAVPSTSTSTLATDATEPVTKTAPASSSLGVEYPSIMKILRFALPAIGVWMCGPILSMIDTAAVGLLAGTAQQAALNPAVSVSDYGALLVAFMFAATTNLVAAAKQEDATSSSSADKDVKTTNTLVTALRLALIVGVTFGTVLSLSSKFLVRALVGNDTLDPIVATSALRYVRIRCLGMPAAAIVGTAQSASLALGDVKSPLIVLAAAALTNLLGDALLVGQAHPWLGGAAGAAWATVLSQYFSLFLFLKWLTTSTKTKATTITDENTTSPPPVVDVTKGIMELFGTSKEGKSRRKQFKQFVHETSLSTTKKLSLHKRSWDEKKSLIGGDIHIKAAVEEKAPSSAPSALISRGFLAGKVRGLKDLFSLTSIDKTTAKEFIPFVVPVTTTTIGRVSGYVAMSHVASSTLGCLDMAAHQIVFSIFCCLTPVVDALNQVAQSFVPGVYERTPKTCPDRATSLAKTVSNFTKCGAGFGAVLLAMAACIPYVGRFFTTDALVLSSVNGAIPGVGLFLVLNGFMCAGEGSLMGQKDLNFLRNMYAIYFFTVPAYMLRLKRRSLAGIQDVGIGTMWAAFSGYQVIRTIIWHLRLRQLRRRTDREVQEAAVADAHCEEWG